MNLKRCPECNKIINVGDLEDIDPEEIIGCGLNEGCFAFCDQCGHKNNPYRCNKLRHESGLTQTTVKEYGESL